MITSVVCPGGWHFPQVLSSGQTVKIIGFSFEQLLENILDFRRRHLDLCGAENAAIEAVRRDLKDYLCAHFKQNCADSGQGPGFPARVGIGVTNYQRPIDRGGNWLGTIGNMALEKVDPALAAQRAHICAQCPSNVKWQTGCQSCNDNVEIRIQNAIGSAYTPYDRNLFMCRVWGHANRVAVWLKETHSSSEHQAPEICWVPKKGG
jgi:hypothetical protein